MAFDKSPGRRGEEAPAGVPVALAEGRGSAMNEHLDDILYPEIEPYATGELIAGEGNRLYYEQCGNPEGKPVVFLHGGPGAGTSSWHRRFFVVSRGSALFFRIKKFPKIQNSNALVSVSIESIMRSTIDRQKNECNEHIGWYCSFFERARRKTYSSAATRALGVRVERESEF